MKRLITLLAAIFLGASASLSAADKPLPALPDSPSTMPVLLGLEPVRKDLGISSLQEALLDSLRAEYKAKVSVTATAGLTDPSIAAKCEADLNKWRVAYNKRALHILNPQQQIRLRQIERQMLQGYFLKSPSEQKLLGFTAEQTKKAADIAAYDRKKDMEINAKFQAGKISPFKKDIEIHQLRSTTGRSMLHLLTPAQTAQYMGLQGPKMKL
jgi:hypothetical protein